MGQTTTLNVLGFFPERLNQLIELSDESKGFTSFNVLKNMYAEKPENFISDKNYDVKMFNYFEGEDNFTDNDFYAFGVIGIQSKEKVYNYFNDTLHIPKNKFLRLIHPTSYVSKSVAIDYGIQIEALTSISAQTKIGFGVNIKRNCAIGHHAVIGDYVTINPGAIISGFVNIGSNTMIGTGAIIRDGVSIGKNTIIGMGSNVVKDIPDHAVAFGNPCKVHRFNNPQNQTEQQTN